MLPIADSIHGARVLIYVYILARCKGYVTTAPMVANLHTLVDHNWPFYQMLYRLYEKFHHVENILWQSAKHLAK